MAQRKAATTNRDSTGGTVPMPAAAQGGPISHAIFRVARVHRKIAGQL